MSGVVNVISRPVGADDISFGANSFVYVDINGTAHRVNQVNAASIPWLSIPGLQIEALVNSSESLPVSASNLLVAGTSVFSGPLFGSGTVSGLVFNNASGQLIYGQPIPTGAIPTGIPASNIGAGIVNNTEFGYLDGSTSNIQSQINTINSSIANVAGLVNFQPKQLPTLVWSSITVVKVIGTTSTPAWVIANGFPDMLNVGQFVTAGITNSQYYSVTDSTTANLTFPTNLYGSVEASSQWYAVYAVCSAGSYVLKGMPFLRWKSEANQVISLGTNLTPANGIGYGFSTNQFVNGYIYILSGVAQGQLRTITANNNDSGSGGTIQYSGQVLGQGQGGMSSGDWFIIIPPSINFRHIGEVYNNASGDIDQFYDSGTMILWAADKFFNCGAGGTYEVITHFSPLAREVRAFLNGSGTIQIGDSRLSSNYTFSVIVGQGTLDFTLSFCKFKIAIGGSTDVYRTAYRKLVC